MSTAVSLLLSNASGCTSVDCWVQKAAGKAQTPSPGWKKAASLIKSFSLRSFLSVFTIQRGCMCWGEGEGYVGRGVHVSVRRSVHGHIHVGISVRRVRRSITPWHLHSKPVLHIPIYLLIY